MKKCLALAGLVVSSAAITITSPTASEQWDLSQTNTIRWDAAPADKENFNILLVDEFASGRPNQTIATNVAPSAHNYVIQNVQVPNATYGYIFVFVGTDARVNPGVIGNSAVFNVTKSGTVASSTSSTATATSTVATFSKSSGADVGRSFGVAGPVAALFAMLL